MRRPNVTLVRVAAVGTALVGGAVGTVAAGLLLLAVVVAPLQAPVYRALYLTLGPWGATEAATVLSFSLGSALALGAPVLAVSAALDRAVVGDAVAAGVAAGVLLVEATLAGLALTGLLGFPSVLAVFALVAVAGLIGLLARRARAVTVAAFVGSLPALVLLLALLGFGLGWGGGYDVVAREVPAADVTGTPPPAFDDAPAVREDLFAPATCDVRDGTRTCRLSLRGYPHEAQVARLLAAHGVRCPFRGDDADGGAVVLAHGDTYYRVTCVAYGD
ncbi:MAG: hypothetical protein ABEJ70_09055 [Halobacteriaceae archaeon]